MSVPDDGRSAARRRKTRDPAPRVRGRAVRRRTREACRPRLAVRIEVADEDEQLAPRPRSNRRLGRSERRLGELAPRVRRRVVRGAVGERVPATAAAPADHFAPRPHDETAAGSGRLRQLTPLVPRRVVRAVGPNEHLLARPERGMTTEILRLPGRVGEPAPGARCRVVRDEGVRRVEEVPVGRESSDAVDQHLGAGPDTREVGLEHDRRRR